MWKPRACINTVEAPFNIAQCFERCSAHTTTPVAPSLASRISIFGRTPFSGVSRSARGWALFGLCSLPSNRRDAKRGREKLRISKATQPGFIAQGCPRQLGATRLPSLLKGAALNLLRVPRPRDGQEAGRLGYLDSSASVIRVSHEFLQSSHISAR